MSGHSKWKTNKSRKNAADAKRGAAFTKLIKEITVAAREAGGNPDTNPRLRTAINRAREFNMPNDNVKTAIQRGTGELPGVVYEPVMYEAYGPGGVAIMIEGLTDNKNRTTAELRNILSKKNGNMAGAGAVAWMFSRRGYIVIDKAKMSEDDVVALIDVGAEDYKALDTSYEIYTATESIETVKEALKQKGIEWQDAEVTMVPSSTIRLGMPEAKQLLSLIDSLEEHDDVQQVYANFDIPDEILDEASRE